VARKERERERERERPKLMMVLVTGATTESVTFRTIIWLTAPLVEPRAAVALLPREREREGEDVTKGRQEAGVD
jgi:hypothetical protein